MAGRIPQPFLDELLSRVDIVEVVGQRVPLRQAGREYTARCPFHEERTPSFTVSPAKQFYHCFGCGAHGNAIGFLMAHDGLSFPEAVEELAARAGLEVPREAGAGADPRQEALLTLLQRAARLYRRWLGEEARAQDYLRRRGIAPETAEAFALGYAPRAWTRLLEALGRGPRELRLLGEAGLAVSREGGRRYDRFRDRLLFPIRDRRGRVLGFGGRALGEEQPKYLNSPESPVFHKGRLLYGLYEALQAGRLERLLVVEGYMDVVSLHQHGLPWAVATLGTAVTREQVEALFRTAPRLVFCFDGDAAGRRAAWRALEQALPALREGREVRFLFLPEGEDPDSLVRREGGEAFGARTENAVPFSAFLTAELRRRTDTGSVEGRARLVELARPLLSKLASGVLRHMMAEELARLAGTPAELLLGEAAPGPARQRGAEASRPAGARPGGAPGGAAQGPSRAPGAGRPRPVRLALALLLQDPSLARHTPPPPAWEGVELPGLELLREVAALLRERPLPAGALLERWRDTPQGELLARVARWRHPVPPEGAEREFRDIMAWLDQQAREARIRALLEQARERPLGPGEKAELQALLRRRGRMPVEPAADTGPEAGAEPGGGEPPGA